MVEFYRVYGKDNDLILFNTYMSFRSADAKETSFGKFMPKMMVSIGRRPKDSIDKKQIERLPEGVRKKLIERYKTETLMNPKITLSDSIKNILLGMTRKIEKMLGISVVYEKDTKSFELYEFLKIDEPEELIPILKGFGMMMGKLMKKDKENSLLKLIEAKHYFEAGFRKGLEEEV